MKTMQKRSLSQMLHDVFADQAYTMSRYHEEQEDALQTVLEIHRQLF